MTPSPASFVVDDASGRDILRGGEAHLRVPTRVPIFVHRYPPAAPAPENPPVFSIQQTDVIYYGDDLVDYVAHEFQIPPFHPNPVVGPRRVPFWSDLADGVEAARL